MTTISVAPAAACRLCSRSFVRANVRRDRTDSSLCSKCRDLSNAYSRASGGRR